MYHFVAVQRGENWICFCHQTNFIWLEPHNTNTLAPNLFISFHKGYLAPKHAHTTYHAQFTFANALRSFRSDLPSNNIVFAQGCIASFVLVGFPRFHFNLKYYLFLPLIAFLLHSQFALKMVVWSWSMGLLTSSISLTDLSLTICNICPCRLFYQINVMFFL